ncbi:hypothetical protein GGR57DRAFT_499644 [Xylariaceae sp. FL1272]|nr:hypothetical protein GGR57DRAFT_499644 [Xylariaceae sp. FL1272]
MATMTVMPSSLPDKPAFTPIIAPDGANPGVKDDFTPSKHISFKDVPKTYTMKELGFQEDQGISPIAVSEPFPLFTQACVQRMRREVLAPEVFENCQYSSNLAHCYLRGFANKYAPFVYDAWKNPETLAIVSKIAGIDLVPALDIDIAHINLSVKSEEEKREELEAVKERANHEADEGIAGCPWEDDKPIVGWHTDSYPFVCVTMLSDCAEMVGGETALRTGTGDIIKVRGPQMGCAVVLQGRYIEHQALRTLGGTERITMVTSFRPRDPSARDDTVLTTVRPISNVTELYNQFSEYRFEILEERLRLQLKEIREMMATGRGVPTQKLKSFITEQERFLAHMNKEMVNDEEIVYGMLVQDVAQDKVDESRIIKPKSPKSRKRQRRT